MNAVVIEDRAVQAAFAHFISVGQNPPMAAIGNAIKESTRLRFHDGRGPDGAAWAPVLRGGSPLRNTGAHLMNRISSIAQGDTAFVGVPFGWAWVHQFGATISAKSAPWLRFKIGNRWARKKSVTIPARPFFGIDAEDRITIIGILRRALVGE
jgi:phage virion morphogenesis protein